MPIPDMPLPEDKKARKHIAKTIVVPHPVLVSSGLIPRDPEFDTFTRKIDMETREVVHSQRPKKFPISTSNVGIRDTDVKKAM